MTGPAAGGSDIVEGIWSPASAALVATLQPRPFDRRITRLAIIGPAGSRFTLYSGLVISDLYVLTTTNLGNRNTANLGAGRGWSPLTLPAGTSALGVWTSGATGAAATGQLTVFYETGTDG